MIESLPPTKSSPVHRLASPRTAAAFSTKITDRHLQRIAIVYVRQSTARQVDENIESTQLQYRLADRAVALGWAQARIDVIDDDLGVSGKSIEGRVGFQRLMAEVSMEHVGIILGIEMSRLARSCRDWHHLLELCSLFGTLLADTDGVYDPRDHNDRLLLGLKGTMSEAELHVLRGRLRAGQLSKARRGEFFTHAPIGYVREGNTLVKDPDDQARDFVSIVFEKFTELGSASALLKYLRRHNIQIGVRDHRGALRGQLQWRRPTAPTLQNMLHHPVYAGAYVYGRRETNPRKIVAGQPGKGRRWATPENWDVLLKDHLPAYITWDQWEKNQQKLAENSPLNRNGSAPRGTSLLAGRVLCGRCGYRMIISYAGKTKARFTCDAMRNHRADSQCQAFNAKSLYELVERQIVVALQPASIELSLRAASEIEEDRSRLLSHHRQSIERATYECQLAGRRYEEVDPSNRLVASELERRWEQALIKQRQAEEELERTQQQQSARLSDDERRGIESLSSNIPALWHAPTTTGLDRQAIVRIMIERVEVTVVGESERMEVTIHWTGGFTSCHQIKKSVGSFEKLESADRIRSRIVQMKRRGHTHQGIADDLNNAGYRSALGRKFTTPILSQLCRNFAKQGEHTSPIGGFENHWTLRLLAEELGLSKSTLQNWKHRGWVTSVASGKHQIFKADEKELIRLRQLVEHQKQGNRPAPKSLTTPQ